jgi:hypothetical protein
MTGLVRGIATEDGRLISPEPVFTYRGLPVAEMNSPSVEVAYEIGPDETDDDDETQEAA